MSFYFCFVYIKIWGLEICTFYNLNDPVEFVEKWMAYSISNLSGADPTLQYINDFENKEFKNQNHASSKARRPAERSKLKVYNQESDDEENDILGAYVCITPKVSYRLSTEFSPSSSITIAEKNYLRAVTKFLSCKLNLN